MKYDRHGACAQRGQQFHRHSYPIGRATLKSANNVESPTGFRSRGPAAERQARRLARQVERKDKITVYDNGRPR